MASFGDPPSYGPRGLLGLPPARFVEPIVIGYGRSLTRDRATQHTAEAWVRPAATPVAVTQLSAEAWVKNYRNVSTGFVYGLDRMGPQGFLGVAPATFRDRATVGTADPGAHPSVGPNAIPDDRYGLGPRGLLGIPVRKFREQGFTSQFGSPSPGPAAPGAEDTQLSAEAWARTRTITAEQATQLTAEAWVRSPTTSEDWGTQLTAEAWVASTPFVPPGSGVQAFLWVIT